jgi:hypothetical protein
LRARLLEQLGNNLHLVSGDRALWVLGEQLAQQGRAGSRQARHTDELCSHNAMARKKRLRAA